MDNQKIQNGINDLKKIQMSSEEKDQILSNILNSPISSAKPIKSPYSFASLFQRNHLAFYMTVCCLIILFGGGGIALNYVRNQKNEVAQNLIKNTQLINNQLPSKPTTENPQIAKIDNKETSASPVINNTTTSKLIENTNSSSAGLSTSQATIPPNTGTSMGVTSSASSVSGNINSQKYIDIARPAFIVWFEQLAKEQGDVLDYKINKINFIALKKTANEPEKDWFNASASDDAFIVTVDFSVQTTDEGKRNYWMAGNGTEGPDGWILNKFLFITIDKENNTYMVTNAGTGP